MNDDQMRSALTRLAPDVGVDPAWRDLQARMTRDRRRRRGLLAVGAAAVVVIASLVAVSKSGSGPTTRRVTTSPAAPVPGGTSGPAQSFVPSTTTSPRPPSGTWRQLPSPPLRLDSAISAVSTGTELVIRKASVDGASGELAYDPARDSWRLLPPSPLPSATCCGEAVWTGTEAVFTAGAAGAAFNSATNRWRLLPPLPLPMDGAVASVWTGTEVVLWGPAGRTASPAGVAYNPTTNRWWHIANAPILMTDGNGVWTGQHLIIVGTVPDVVQSSETPSAAAQSYDPAADRWQVLPGPGLLPQGATTAFWTGSRLIAMNYQLDARAFDLTTRMWTDLPKLPFPARECYPTSTSAPDPPILFYCGATVQPTGTGWRQLPEGPRGRKPGIVAVGNTLITINQNSYKQASRLDLPADVVTSSR